MILRIVQGSAAAGTLAALRTAYGRQYVPQARSTPGLVRFHAGVRERDGQLDVVTITFWDSVEAALAAFDGDLTEARTLGGLDEVASFTSTAYYEVDETQFRRSEEEVEVLRVTVGQTGTGQDVDIQQEVRRRLPEIGDEMVEAYVGRRMLGSTVEVMFVSAWCSVPSGRSLDEPIWPDISSRYDSFVARTYVPLTAR